MATGTQELVRRKRIKRFKAEQKARRRKDLAPITFRDLEQQDLERDEDRRVREARKVGGCAVPGCEARHQAKGYCAKHYQRMKRIAAAQTITLGH